ncbi:cyclase family protein [Pontibacillus marinus]|uniref:Cyclase n=1 Tax=Pontibacillus marinus BH030004 = DSM 16465 TaxID=1385511 RepID=A0A0A5G542_9BACI|nr:cyclase family protein [Pontibacillus marinus]KGX86273.1 cyclase [Pontibacillus marinus BH030004 = DSM 16465]
MKMIDLSVPLSPKVKEPTPPSIQYKSHEDGAHEAIKHLGIQKTDLHNGKAWATEEVTASTHAGTHIDAPYHYSETSEGKPARTIDQLPIEWFYGDGVLFDFSDQSKGYEITSEDFKKQLSEMNYSLKRNDIVLIRTDADKKLYEDGYAFCNAGVTAEATRWLINQGITVMGIDAWGWDIPLDVQVMNYKKDPKSTRIWDAHLVGIEQEYCQIEKLANLDQIPKRHGFKVSCFPVKIENASGAWARPVAIID